MHKLEKKTVIHFSASDAAGVVFYPRALSLAHDAVEDLINRSTLGHASWFASAEHAAPVRRVEADFMKPIHPGETMTTRTRVEKLGNTSVTFLVEFINAAGEIAASIRTTHVLVDKATGRAMPLTTAIRSAFGTPSEI
jgi:YbgC/YbaW family acyl-CoA thioester hydrolase